MNFKRKYFVLWLAMFSLCCARHLSAADLETTNIVATDFTPPPAGAVVIWNGHDLTGWRIFLTNGTASAAWHSDSNGVLHLAGKPVIGFLQTTMTFSNFHLHVEWRWPETNGNSGVFVHMNGADAIWPVSVECQLKSGSAGELVGQGGVDFPAPLINGKKRAKITTPSERPVGEWNAYDIVCRDDTIEARVNGVRQNRIVKVTVSSGAVGLQIEGFPVEFRNLWLEQLK